jgi:hypothetical protein
MRLSSTTPDFQMYDNRNIYQVDYNKQSSRPVIHLQQVEMDPTPAPAPMYYHTIGLGLQNNESLGQIFRDEEMPSVIHVNTITHASRDSLREDSPQ